MWARIIIDKKHWKPSGIGAHQELVVISVASYKQIIVRGLLLQISAVSCCPWVLNSVFLLLEVLISWNPQTVTILQQNCSDTITHSFINLEKLLQITIKLFNENVFVVK